MKINKEWHEKNEMPKNPTPEEQLNWHLEHAKNCNCRPLTKSMLEKLKNNLKK